MYFAKYLGTEANILNGLVMEPNHVYLFTHGSAIKGQAGDAWYFSDVVAHFNDELQTTPLSFNANLGEVRFPSGNFGLRDLCISEGPGRLIGIMGASGAGKSTLIKTLSEGTNAIFVVFRTPEEGVGIPVSLRGFSDGFAQLP